MHKLGERAAYKLWSLAVIDVPKGRLRRGIQWPLAESWAILSVADTAFYSVIVFGPLLTVFNFDGRAEANMSQVEKAFSAIPELLETERLALRRPHQGDGADYIEVFGNSIANANNSRGFCRNLSAALAALTVHQENWQVRGFDVWAICLRESPNRAIGFGGLGLRDFDGEERLNLGYGLSTQFWGKGYAKELALMSVHLARSQSIFATLLARVKVGNAASRKVLDFLGMSDHW